MMIENEGLPEVTFILRIHLTIRLTGEGLREFVAVRQGANDTKSCRRVRIIEQAVVHGIASLQIAPALRACENERVPDNERTQLVDLREQRQ